MTDILEKLKNNDKNAWNSFYNSNVNGIYRYMLYRCSHDKALAEDMVQQVFLVAVDKINSFSGSCEKLPNWLFGIARIELLQYYRNNKTLLNSFDETSCTEPENIEAQDDYLIDQALTNLSDMQSKVLMYKYYDQLSVKEISRKTGRSNKAVESLLTRAREAFKKIYMQIQQEER